MSIIVMNIYIEKNERKKKKMISTIIQTER
jgi:hypothetical protein